MSYVYIIQDHENIVWAGTGLQEAKTYAEAFGYYIITQWNGPETEATHYINLETRKWVREPTKPIQTRVTRPPPKPTDPNDAT